MGCRRRRFPVHFYTTSYLHAFSLKVNIISAIYAHFALFQLFRLPNSRSADSHQSGRNGLEHNCLGTFNIFRIVWLS